MWRVCRLTGSAARRVEFAHPMLPRAAETYDVKTDQGIFHIIDWVNAPK